ncbi:hypothetical protein E4U41_007260 [Claviceps citrina]|nr:hypothetical protein E4U41_007260 [Claviceps citrina]
MSGPMSAACEQLYATMLLSDLYLPGALVLGHSLRDGGTKRKLAALVTLDDVSADSITQLKAVYDYILPVPRIRNQHPENLSLMNRSDLHSAFTKINLWKQIQFSKIVYIDADVVAYRAPDELFDLPYAFSAAPDIGWPDIFNTGVMVLTPNMGDYYAMLAMAERGISFDGADQGLINMHFQHSTNRLPFTYNVTPSAHYQYIPAYLHFQSSISMVHFIGANKPWFSGRNSARSNDPVDQMIGRWWAVHDRHYRAQTGVTDGIPSQLLTDTAADSNRPVSAKFADHHPTEQKIPYSSTPMSSWDAQRPEAVNFPSTHYEMSRDTSSFVPPMRYPSPPKNMWYEVPKQPTSAGKPRQIFPWEAKQPTPSRLFTDPVTHEPNQILSAAEAGESSEDLAQGTSLTGASPDSKIITVRRGDPQDERSESAPATIGDPWSSFSRANAWDEIPGIGRYVEGFQRHRGTNSRSKVNPPGSAMSPSATAATLRMPRALRVTDFPTEAERPSLPVTPAPTKRPCFWGEDNDQHDTGHEAHALPVAEGVPSQPDWDPAAQLQKLAQQQSEALLRRLSGDDGETDRRLSQDLPSRPLPFGSEPLHLPTHAGTGTSL